MEGRKRMVSGVGPAIFEVEGELISFAACRPFAELGNLPANVVDYVYEMADGRFLRMTIGSDSDRPGDVLGSGDRWYAARVIDEEEEPLRWRESWAMHRKQPDMRVDRRRP